MRNKKRIPIPEEDKAKLFLWCARHCCFCGKSCTTNIEIHHIDGDPANNELDNLIPVCFDCHGELEKYNPDHPVGTKYRFLEIKTRREQIYEKHTLSYLRQVEIRISNFIANSRVQREVGDISCTVRTLSQDIPVKLRLQIEPYQGEKKIEFQLGDLYEGEALWNLNPSQIVYGHFGLPITRKSDPFMFRVEISWSIIDVLGREHQMLPFSYVWDNAINDWWYDPRVIFGK
ncbi:MAG: HNH endonuclease [Desulfobacca sp.]|nr:HNH endonuclease [Desulfobacca sp.]